MTAFKFVTTIGCELTFTATFMEDVYAAADKERNNCALMDSAAGYINTGLAEALRVLLRAKKIPFLRCGTDPGVVEVSTKPYTTAKTFENACYKIMKEASNIYLHPWSEWIGGGGAHIHAGIPSHLDEREQHQFIRRMMVWAARNPWLCWAFVSVNDDINAEPLTQEDLTEDDDSSDYSIEFLKLEIQEHNDDLERYIRQMHEQTGFSREIASDRVDRARKRLMKWRLRLARKLVGAKTSGTKSLSSIRWKSGKSHVLRKSPYGPAGTIEFRAFEMPCDGDVSTLTLYAKLVNAAVAKVLQETYTTVNMSDIPTHDTLKHMKWSERVRGFNAMLVDLGLDPEEFRAERVKMAVRMRHFRPKPAVKMDNLLLSENQALGEEARVEAREDPTPVGIVIPDSLMPSPAEMTESFAFFQSQMDSPRPLASDDPRYVQMIGRMEGIRLTPALNTTSRFVIPEEVA